MEGEIDNDVVDPSLEVEYRVDTPLLLPSSSDRRAPTFVLFDSCEGITYFTDNNTVGELSPILESLE